MKCAITIDESGRKCLTEQDESRLGRTFYAGNRGCTGSWWTREDSKEPIPWQVVVTVLGTASMACFYVNNEYKTLKVFQQNRQAESLMNSVGNERILFF